MTDPTVGVWISDDGTVGAPDPSNSYRYVGNNPLNEIDPSGLAPRLSDKQVGDALLGTYKDWMRFFGPGNVIGAKWPNSGNYSTLEGVLIQWETDFAIQFTPWYYVAQMFTSNRLIVKNITKQITMLGDGEFNTRENAGDCLVKIGSIAYPFVLVATRDSDLEIRRRAEDIIKIKKMPRTSDPIYNQALLLYLTQRLQQVLAQMNPADRQKVLSIMGNIPAPYPGPIPGLGKILRSGKFSGTQ